MVKRVKNPNARFIRKGQHEQINYHVVGSDDETFNL